MAAKIVISPSKKRKPNLKLNFDFIIGVPFYLLAIILISLPILLMFLYSFNSGGSSVFEINFSLSNYARFFQNAAFLNILVRSLYLAAVGTTITLIIAYPLAYFMARAKIMTRIILMSLVTAPMWLNMFLRANALRQVLNMINPGIVGTQSAIIIGIVYMFLPFMVLPIFTILTKVDKSLYEGAADLGANGLKTFIKVILPLSMSGVISGVMLVFLPAATSIVIPHSLGAGQAGTLMIGQFIETMINEGSDIGFGAAIAIVVGLILIGFIWLIRKTDKYGGGLDEKDA